MQRQHFVKDNGIKGETIESVMDDEAVYFFFAASSSSFCRHQNVQSKKRRIVRIITNLLSTKLACTFVSLIRAGNAECPERLELVLFGGDLSGGLSREGVGKGNRSTGSSSLEILSLFTRVQSRSSTVRTHRQANSQKSHPSWACQPYGGRRSNGSCTPSTSPH